VEALVAGAPRYRPPNLNRLAPSRTVDADQQTEATPSGRPDTGDCVVDDHGPGRDRLARQAERCSSLDVDHHVGELDQVDRGQQAVALRLAVTSADATPPARRRCSRSTVPAKTRTPWCP